MTREPRTVHQRLVTLGLQHNLAQIRWAWERPALAHGAVSVPMQLTMTLLTLVAVCPIEEMLTDLAPDPMTTRVKAAFTIPDLTLQNPDGFAAQLGSWRRAIATGRIELFVTSGGRRLDGLRAWLPPSAEEEGWSMALDTERLSAIVHGLVHALPYWGIPLDVTPPPKQRR